MRALWLFTHRWLGLSLGLLVAWMGLTGSALVYREELEATLHPQLFHVVPDRGHASWQSILSAVKRQYPDHKVGFINVAREADSSHEFWLDDGDLLVYVNPYSGEVLGALGQREGLFNWLADGHIHLFYGKTGERIAGFAGLALLCLSLSGLVVWFPRKRTGWKRAFKPNLRTNRQGQVYELHRAGGFWVSGLLALSATAGMALAWPEVAVWGLNQVFSQPEVKKPKVPHKLPALPLDQLVARAEAAFPEGRLTRIILPSKGGPLVVRKKLDGELHPNGLNAVYIDPGTARILRIDDTRKAGPVQRLMNLRYPVHVGVWGGAWSRPFYVPLGWAPALLGLSGFLMWRRRVRAASNQSIKAST